MLKLRNMKVEDVEIVSSMIALDHDSDLEKGYREAREHTLDHLKIIPDHCYVVEDRDKQIVAAMILHPQEKVFEIEDFHIRGIQRNAEALTLLKEKLLEYLEDVKWKCYVAPMR